MKFTKCKHQYETLGYYFCDQRGRILPAMCERCPDYKAKSKYNNAKTKMNGIEYDSKKEAARASELAMLEKSGVIKNLQRQVRFEVVPKTETERAVYYQADFVYEQQGKLICEDVKSPPTRANPAYIIKRKLFKYRYPEYEFREV